LLDNPFGKKQTLTLVRTLRVRHAHVYFIRRWPDLFSKNYIQCVCNHSAELAAITLFVIFHFATFLAHAKVLAISCFFSVLRQFKIVKPTPQPGGKKPNKL
jgi:hypothetical protein